jgi:hypothetical protein
VMGLRRSSLHAGTDVVDVVGWRSAS